ncbi:hypothetical protein DKX38_028758 [Salix brachista]|uniref:Exosome RNA helicase MTR4-like beta-barrel domain-containing protein n=1 Tax=Salix brachista TaxID=2182728 RepID=A0A5N5J7B0_9ROSI|nr:hypothetical protein DKX38_028758 [Salix brachista]
MIFSLSLISIITIGIGNEVFSIGICFFTRQGGTGWGLGIVVNVVKKPTAGLGALPSKGGGYIVDTLLHCSPGPRVPVQLPLICARSKVRISIPADLRPLEGRQSILLAVQELGNRFPEGLPKLNPVKVDMKIEDPEIVKLRVAAQAVGEVSLESKFAAASESLRRGSISFSPSLLSFFQ